MFVAEAVCFPRWKKNPISQIFHKKKSESFEENWKYGGRFF